MPQAGSDRQGHADVGAASQLSPATARPRATERSGICRVAARTYSHRDAACGSAAPAGRGHCTGSTAAPSCCFRCCNGWRMAAAPCSAAKGAPAAAHSEPRPRRCVTSVYGPRLKDSCVLLSWPVTRWPNFCRVNLGWAIALQQQARWRCENENQQCTAAAILLSSCAGVAFEKAAVAVHSDRLDMHMQTAFCRSLQAEPHRAIQSPKPYARPHNWAQAQTCSAHESTTHRQGCAKGKGLT